MTDNLHIFRVGRAHIIFVWSNAFAWTIGALICGAVSYFEGGSISGAPQGLPLAYLMGAFFATLGWLSFRSARRLPLCEVAADNEGIWMTHATRDRGMIVWQQASAARDRQFSQCTDLIGTDGTVLLSLSHQLAKYEQLLMIVSEKCTLLPRDAAIPAELRCRRPCRLWDIGALGGFLAVTGWWAVVGTLSFYAYMGCVALVALEIALTLLRERSQLVRRLEFGGDHIRIIRLAHTQIVHQKDIIHIGIRDERRYAVGRVPQVVVLVRDRKRPIELSCLGVSSVYLCQVMARWARIKDGVGPEGGRR